MGWEQEEKNENVTTGYGMETSEFCPWNQGNFVFSLTVFFYVLF